MTEVVFLCDEGLLGVIPEPRPAGKFVPEWFKNLPMNISDDVFENAGRSVKACVPFLRALTAGYMIPLWTDLEYNAADKNGDRNIDIRTAQPGRLFESHDKEQIAGSPFLDHPFGELPTKLLNPWIIKTAPGISCLFTRPLNHGNNGPINIISGVVDTDRYNDRINFPFLWDIEVGERGVVRAGTPIVQVIPFRREDFTSTVRAISPEEEMEARREAAKMRVSFGGNYADKVAQPQHFKEGA